MPFSAARPAPVNKWLVTGSIAFGSLMAAIDSSIVNVALPKIRGTVGATVEEITWVSTSLHHRDGPGDAAHRVPRLVLRAEARLRLQPRRSSSSARRSAASRARCRCSCVYRAIQGFGAGALQPTQQAILRQTFPPKEQGMAMAMFAMGIMIGPAVGPTLGGYIVDHYSWPWIFYINLPVGVRRHDHDAPLRPRARGRSLANRARAEVQKKNLDIAGIVLMCVGYLDAAVRARRGAAQRLVRLSAHHGPLLRRRHLARRFVIRELTATAPVVNLRIFGDKTFASATRRSAASCTRC